ncbi:MAG: hypothetical protein R3Y64_07885 [Peptostreptococcaceae bacterium]
MIKYKQIISCAFCSLLIGCASSTDSVKVDFLDEKEMVSVHNLIHTINSEDLKSFNEIKKIIDENIPRMKNEVDRDNAIIKYIQIYNNLVVNAMNKLSYLGYEMEEVISQYEVEINNISSYDKIPNEYGTVKGFLNEIYSNGLVLYLHSNNQGYFVDENGEFLNYVSQFYQNEIDDESSISVLIEEILQ